MIRMKKNNKVSKVINRNTSVTVLVTKVLKLCIHRYSRRLVECSTAFGTGHYKPILTLCTEMDSEHYVVEHSTRCVE